MPAVINIAANLALGGGFALVARTSPALRRDFINWALLFLMAFEALVFTPVATYLFRFYPQWSMLYWFDPQIFPHLESWIGALSFVAVLFNFAAALLGYTVARHGVLTEQRWMSLLPLAAGAVWTLGVLVLYAERVAYIGDYDSFWQGNAELLFLRTPGWIGILLYASATAYVLFVRARFSNRDPSLV